MSTDEGSVAPEKLDGPSDTKEQRWTISRRSAPAGLYDRIEGSSIEIGQSIDVVPADKLEEVEKERDEFTGEHQWVRLDRHLDLVGEFRTRAESAEQLAEQAQQSLRERDEKLRELLRVALEAAVAAPESKPACERCGGNREIVTKFLGSDSTREVVPCPHCTPAGEKQGGEEEEWWHTHSASKAVQLRERAAAIHASQDSGAEPVTLSGEERKSLDDLIETLRAERDSRYTRQEVEAKCDLGALVRQKGEMRAAMLEAVGFLAAPEPDVKGALGTLNSAIDAFPTPAPEGEEGRS